MESGSGPFKSAFSRNFNAQKCSKHGEKHQKYSKMGVRMSFSRSETPCRAWRHKGQASSWKTRCLRWSKVSPEMGWPKAQCPCSGKEFGFKWLGERKYLDFWSPNIHFPPATQLRRWRSRRHLLHKPCSHDFGEMQGAGVALASVSYTIQAGWRCQAPNIWHIWPISWFFGSMPRAQI